MFIGQGLKNEPTLTLIILKMLMVPLDDPLMQVDTLPSVYYVDFVEFNYVMFYAMTWTIVQIVFHARKISRDTVERLFL